MPPDLNSLPPSPNPATIDSPRTMAQNDHSQVHSPPTHSLAAAAALNAGLHNSDSRRSSNSSLRDSRTDRRRRSSIRMSLNLNDPTIPGPGELQTSPRASRSGSSAFTASPSHQRAPSLGELHQEWESEQEMQVNRLLNMIRQQQATIQTIQSQNAPNTMSSVAVDDSTPTSERSMSLSHTAPPPTSANHTPSTSLPRSRSPYINHSLSRNPSYRSGRSSHDASPQLHPAASHISPMGEGNEIFLGAAAVRDESAFYQAETQNLTRENQMLKSRIRELERQLNEFGPAHSNPHSPVTTSNLHRPPLTNPELDSTQATTLE